MAKTIMTVDDAVTMRKLILFTLNGAGHNVLEAEDGIAALALLSSQKVDLVISDINMPRMNGIELIRKLRELPLHKDTPILVLTTESDAAMKNKAKMAGATGWIVKPFRPDQLTEVVGRVLGKA
jgi:two-component system chemotaxis response regulator CheY